MKRVNEEIYASSSVDEADEDALHAADWQAQCATIFATAAQDGLWVLTPADFFDAFVDVRTEKELLRDFPHWRDSPLSPEKAIEIDWDERDLRRGQFYVLEAVETVDEPSAVFLKMESNTSRIIEAIRPPSGYFGSYPEGLHLRRGISTLTIGDLARHLRNVAGDSPVMNFTHIASEWNRGLEAVRARVRLNKGQNAISVLFVVLPADGRHRAFLTLEERTKRLLATENNTLPWFRLFVAMAARMGLSALEACADRIVIVNDVGSAAAAHLVQSLVDAAKHRPLTATFIGAAVIGGTADAPASLAVAQWLGLFEKAYKRSTMPKNHALFLDLPLSTPLQRRTWFQEHPTLRFSSVGPTIDTLKDVVVDYLVVPRAHKPASLQTPGMTTLVESLFASNELKLSDAGGKDALFMPLRRVVPGLFDPTHDATSNLFGFFSETRGYASEEDLADDDDDDDATKVRRDNNVVIDLTDDDDDDATKVHRDNNVVIDLTDDDATKVRRDNKVVIDLTEFDRHCTVCARPALFACACGQRDAVYCSRDRVCQASHFIEGDHSAQCSYGR